MLQSPPTDVAPWQLDLVLPWGTLVSADDDGNGWVKVNVRDPSVRIPWGPRSIDLRACQFRELLHAKAAFKA